jgi:hypothetical protein
MKPQYVARQSSSDRGFEASSSQRGPEHPCGYLFATGSHSLSDRFTQVTYTSKGTGVRDFSVDLVRTSDRRQICLRASNWLPYSALYSQRPLAHVKHRLKSSLWLIPRRSPLSQHTQASTSNLSLEQSLAPAPSHSLTKVTHQIGGATWH